MKKTIKRSLHILLMVTTLSLQILHAGIYKVVVLKSPNNEQTVRFYFDMHVLGTERENIEQFKIIEGAVKTFSDQKFPFTILVEAPLFYQPPSEKYPEDEEWTLIQETQPITKQAISAGLGKEHEKFMIFSTSLFAPIPLLGKTIEPSNTNIKIISIDPRDILLNFENIVNGAKPICHKLEKSLKDVFDKTIEQMQTTAINIPAKSPLSLPEKNIYLSKKGKEFIPMIKEPAGLISFDAKKLYTPEYADYLSKPKIYNPEYQAKIEEMFTRLNMEFQTYMNRLKTSIGNEAWTCDIFQNISPLIEKTREEKCNNYYKISSDKWPLIDCYNESQQTQIKKTLEEIINAPICVEYVALKYILDPNASNEIAVFIGGDHAASLESTLKELGYKSVYEWGVSPKTEPFHFKFSPESSAHSKYGRQFLYEARFSDRILQVMRNTLMQPPNLSPILPLREENEASDEESEEFDEEELAAIKARRESWKKNLEIDL